MWRPRKACGGAMSGMHTEDDNPPICPVEGCGRRLRPNWRGGTGYRKLCNRHEKQGRYGKSFKQLYCENVDGRLGFVCTATMLQSMMLSVDHIDGNRKHNAAENIQTLCLNCHSYKTIMSGDHLRGPYSTSSSFSPTPRDTEEQSPPELDDSSH